MTEETRSYYISGPMTGFSDHNHGAFNELAHKLRQEGHKVWNPAEEFDGQIGLEWEDYMFVCMRGLMDSDTLIVLPGWNTSVGSRLEVAVAVACGIEVHEVDDDVDEDARRDVVARLIGMEDVRR